MGMIFKNILNIEVKVDNVFSLTREKMCMTKGTIGKYDTCERRNGNISISPLTSRQHKLISTLNDNPHPALSYRTKGLFRSKPSFEKLSSKEDLKDDSVCDHDPEVAKSNIKFQVGGAKPFESISRMKYAGLGKSGIISFSMRPSFSKPLVEDPKFAETPLITEKRKREEPHSKGSSCVIALKNLLNKDISKPIALSDSDIARLNFSRASFNGGDLRSILIKKSKDSSSNLVSQNTSFGLIDNNSQCTRLTKKVSFSRNKIVRIFDNKTK